MATYEVIIPKEAWTLATVSNCSFQTNCNMHVAESVAEPISMDVPDKIAIRAKIYTYAATTGQGLWCWASDGGIVTIDDDSKGITESPFSQALNPGGGLDVNIQDQVTEEINLYFHVDELQTNPSSTLVVDSYTMTVDSVAGISEGDAVTIYESNRVYQSIIADITGTTLTLASSIDYAFTTAAAVHIGAWNLNLNGSGAPIIAHFETAPLAKYDIYRINITMLDGEKMDGSTFGGIDQLTNGIVLRHKNGILKNLALVVNNIGFAEQGFNIDYDPADKKGEYGLRAKKNYKEVSGIAIRTDGAVDDEIQLIIRDNLTSLTLMTATVQGHVVD